MDEIAEVAGTSKPVLYRYFDDQAGLFMAVAQRIDTTIQLRIEAAVANVPGAHDRLAAMINEYLELLESDPEIYRFLESKTLLDDQSYEYPTAELIERMTELFADTFVGDNPQATTPMLMAGIIALVRTATKRWIASMQSGHPVPRAEFARDLTALLWLGAAGTRP